MIPNNNLSVLPWYSSIEQQNARKWWLYGRVYPLYTQAGFILPFQLMVPHVTTPNIGTITLYDANTDQQVANMKNPLLDTGLTTKQFATLGYDIVVYPGLLPAVNQMANGRYYLSAVINSVRYYSDIFTVVNDIEPYLKITWWNIDDFVMDAGTIVYKEPTFKNVLYLQADIAKPEYPFEEEGEIRDGYFFPTKQISEKRYRFNFLASEYLLDVMRFIRMSDYAEIEYHGQRYSLDTFLITPEWESNGDVAAVEAVFDTATVAKKIGLGFTKALRGDFNDDFNNDYNNQNGGGPTYRNGEIIPGLWVVNGTKIGGTSGYQVVTFPVTPGESYNVQTDRTSSAFAFTANHPAMNEPYIGGSRFLAYPNDPRSGVVPSGAAYMTFGQIAPDAGNLFPQQITIGNDIVRVSDYR